MRNPWGIALLLLAVGCTRTEPTRTVVRSEASGQGEVVAVSDADAAMRAAKQKARETLPSFIARLQKPQPGEVFLIKAGLPTDGGSAEHIWIENISFKDGQFKGKLANVPLDLKDLKLGSPVTVNEELVSDWLIMNGKKMEGGFTSAVVEGKEHYTGR